MYSQKISIVSFVRCLRLGNDEGNYSSARGVRICHVLPQVIAGVFLVACPTYPMLLQLCVAGEMGICVGRFCIVRV